MHRCYGLPALAAIALMLLLATCSVSGEGLAEAGRECLRCSRDAKCTLMRNGRMACICETQFTGNGTYCERFIGMSESSKGILLGVGIYLGLAIFVTFMCVGFHCSRRPRGERFRLCPSYSQFGMSDARHGTCPQRVRRQMKRAFTLTSSIGGMVSGDSMAKVAERDLKSVWAKDKGSMAKPAGLSSGLSDILSTSGPDTSAPRIGSFRSANRQATDQPSSDSALTSSTGKRSRTRSMHAGLTEMGNGPGHKERSMPTSKMVSSNNSASAIGKQHGGHNGSNSLLKRTASQMGKMALETYSVFDDDIPLLQSKAHAHIFAFPEGAFSTSAPSTRRNKRPTNTTTIEFHSPSDSEKSLPSPTVEIRTGSAKSPKSPTPFVTALAEQDEEVSPEDSSQEQTTESDEQLDSSSDSTGRSSSEPLTDDIEANISRKSVESELSCDENGAHRNSAECLIGNMGLPRHSTDTVCTDGMLDAFNDFGLDSLEEDLKRLRQDTHDVAGNPSTETTAGGGGEEPRGGAHAAIRRRAEARAAAAAAAAAAAEGERTPVSKSKSFKSHTPTLLKSGNKHGHRSKANAGKKDIKE
ncbi:uncharacterized protein LOC135825959 [Sycon ciliatum]|uniref:uncharacterized protein LOC135825959 n=1 Tax=Sycon ciliatum TaxID=27933 RepID=UPI0031F62822